MFIYIAEQSEQDTMRRRTETWRWQDYTINWYK